MFRLCDELGGTDISLNELIEMYKTAHITYLLNVSFGTRK